MSQSQSFQNHPRFAEAVVTASRAVVELHGTGRLMGWILNDRARALLGHRLLYLEATRTPDEPRSGILPSRVQRDCVELGLCSANRAIAIVRLMQAAGYLEPGPEPEDRRVRRLVPTERLRTMQRARVERQLRAIGAVSDTAGHAADRMGERRFQSALVIALNDYFTGGYRILDAAPEMRVFVDRDAGMLVMCSLLIASHEAGSFPLRQPLSLPIAPLARRLQVSRTHILRLLRDVEAAGLLVRAGDRIEPSPRLGPLALDLYDRMFHMLDRAARHALAATT